VDNIKSNDLQGEEIPFHVELVGLFLLCSGISGYLYCLAQLVGSQNYSQSLPARLCVVGLLAFLGGGFLEQTVVDALLETVPLAINLWMVFEVTVIRRLESCVDLQPEVSRNSTS
jgi:hypothetical protein